MLDIDIPGLGPVLLEHLVSDFTGTLSVDGRLLPGVKDRLNRVAAFLRIHILTADTFGRAKEEMDGTDCILHILSGQDHDIQKETYVRGLGPESVIAFGNGLNDRRMLSAAKIGVAVCLEEGCAVGAVKSADIMVMSALGAFELLLNPKRLKATLRF